jgi:parallel beta-helix repeat protein
MKKIVSGIVSTLLLIGILASVKIHSIGAEPRTWTVDDDGPADFHTIQDAIDAASFGDTVQVRAGTYKGTVNIGKNVSLIGENTSNTVIGGNGRDDVVYIHEVDGGVMSGFTVQDGFNGICTYGSSNISIINNRVVGCEEYGIRLSYSTRITLTENTLSNNRYGVGVEGGDTMYFDHLIDSTNMINGKPMFYMFNRKDVTLDSVETGGLILAFCYNTRIVDSTMGCSDYLDIVFSTDVFFLNNTLGTLYTHFSQNITLVNNTLSNHFFSRDAFGLYIGDGSENVVLRNNNISNNNHDNMIIDRAKKVTLRNNVVSGYANSWDGVWIVDSEEVDLVENIITNNTGAGVTLWRASSVNLYRNTICYNEKGIRALQSRDNNFTENIIMRNIVYGIDLESSSHLSIYHNSLNNTCQLSIHDISNSSWDDGYPSGGNYWSDYNGTEFDDFGIGREPYIIDENNSDMFPLKSPYLSGDINHDLVVNIVDIAIVAKAFGARPGDGNWNPIADMDLNGVINIVDISIVATQYGQKLNP